MSVPIDLTARAILTTSAQNPKAAQSINEIPSAARLPEFTVGQKVQVQVLASLSEGLFLANLNGQAFRISLPRADRLSDNLSLTFLSYSPQPTFQLDDAQGVASIVRINLTPLELNESEPSAGSRTRPLDSAVDPLSLNPEQQLNLSKSSDTSGGTPLNTYSDGISTRATLSEFAQVFGQIFANAKSNKELSILTQTEPVVKQPTDLADPTAVAAALEKVIKSSGLFYEHHLSQWVQKKFEKFALSAEPQNNLDALVARQDGKGSSSLEQALALIVTKQLDVLEKEQIQWLGKLTPETPFEWRISRERENVNHKPKAEEANWQTEVKFNLPNIGEVTATIFLHNSNLKFMLRGETAEILARLKENASLLTDSLSAHGAQISTFTVGKTQ